VTRPVDCDACLQPVPPSATGRCPVCGGQAVPPQAPERGPKAFARSLARGCLRYLAMLLGGSLLGAGTGLVWGGDARLQASLLGGVVLPLGWLVAHVIVDHLYTRALPDVIENLDLNPFHFLLLLLPPVMAAIGWVAGVGIAERAPAAPAAFATTAFLYGVFSVLLVGRRAYGE